VRVCNALQRSDPREVSTVDVHKRLVEIEREALNMGLFDGAPRGDLRRMNNRIVWADQAIPRKEPRIPKHKRPRCGAKTRKGTPCRAPAVSGSNRCRLHGGLSTGARTEEGREAIRTSNRRRAVLADLVELTPAVDEERRRRWADTIVALARDYPHNLGAELGGEVAEAEALGVSVETIARWRESPGFAEAERRANVRGFRRWRRGLRRKAREPRGGMNTMPIESTRIDLDTLPEFDLEAAVADLPELDLEALDLDFEPPPVEPLDLDAIMAGVERNLAELPTLDPEKLLEDLGDPLEGLPAPDFERR